MFRTAAIILTTLFALHAETIVSIRESASVSSEAIRLGDVASISGEHSSLLDTLTVGKASRPGYTRLLLRDELLHFVKLPEGVRESVKLTGSERCRVSSVGQEISLKDVREKLLIDLSEKLIWNSGSWEMAFRKEDTTLVTLWKGSYTVEVGELRNSALKGNVMIPVIFHQGDLRERVTLQGELTVVEMVYVATRNLRQGETVSPSDYRREKMDISHLPYQPVVALEPGAEYRIRSGVIQAGAVLTENKIQKSRLVERGAPVTIVSKVGTASVVVQGRARQAGDIGDIISVENSTSRKIVRGTVIKPGVVMVYKGGEV